MKKLLSLLFVILSSFSAFAQHDKLQVFQKIDGLGTYNVSYIKSLLDTLVVSVPFINQPGTFLKSGVSNTFAGTTTFTGGGTATLGITSFSAINLSTTQLALSINGSVGTNGQILTSNGTIASWQDAIGGVTAVTGTTNRITSTGGTTPQIDLSTTLENSFGKVANPLSQFASTTSAQLAGVISNETGTGVLVYSDSPAFTTSPVAPTQSLNDNSTKIATTAYVDRLTLNIGTTLQNIAGNLNISSTYPGQSSITTLGTIGTGVWNGSVIGIAYGGLGSSLSDPAANKLLAWDDTDNTNGYWTLGSGLSYNHSTHTISTTNSGTVTSITLTQPSAGLTITGSGTPITSTGTPTFALADDLAAIEGLATTGIVRRTGSSTWSAGTLVDLTSEVTGITPPANGGTGASSFPGWLLASGGTFTGANTVIGSTSNTLTFRFPSLGTTATEVFKLENNTAAALGAQQISPPLVFSGLGWGTTAGTSQSVKFKEYLLPVQSTVPTGTLTWESSIAGGAYATRMNLTSAGALTVTDGTSPIFLTPSAGTLGFLAGGAIQTGGSTRIGISNIGTQTHAKTAQSSGNTNFVTWTSPASTSQTASTEESQWIFDASATLQFINGTLANQRFTKFIPGTVAFTSASSATKVSTVSIGGPFTGGTNATLARTVGLSIEAGVAPLTNSTLGVGLDVAAPSGATGNLAATFTGSTVFGATTITAGPVLVDMQSTTMGFSPPKMTTTQRDAISGIDGLYVHNTTTHTLDFHNGTAWGNVALTGDRLGVATNSNAAAGYIGEEIKSVISSFANYTTTATFQNVTSISLTAGDWDVSAMITVAANSSTLSTNPILAATSTTTAATDGHTVSGVNTIAILSSIAGPGGGISGSIPPYRVSLASTTTIYFITQATFTIGNPQYVGSIRARRIR